MSNSGSQTRQRVQTAAVMIAALLALLFFAPFWLFVAAICALSAVGGWEWAGLAGWRRGPRIAFAALIALSIAGLGHVTGHDSWIDAAVLLAASLFWCVVVPLSLRCRWSGRGARGLSGALVLLPLAWSAFWVIQQPSGAVLLLGGMAFVWVSDSAAYFAGRAFGRHPLAPSISPKKSWEGVAGAVAGVLAYGCALQWLAGAVLPTGLAATLTLGVAMCALGIVGDLYESWAKRVAEVKDSGHWLPGHGGLLDRIDGLAAAMPLWAAGLWFAGFGA